MNGFPDPPRVLAKAVNLLAALIDLAERKKRAAIADELRRIAFDISFIEFKPPCPMDAMTTLMEQVSDCESIAYRQVPTRDGMGGAGGCAMARAVCKVASIEDRIRHALQREEIHKLLQQLGRAPAPIADEEVDDISLFLEERCEHGHKLAVPQTELYQAYEAWCATRGTVAIPRRCFNAWMGRAGYPRKRTSWGGADSVRLWDGVDLRRPLDNFKRLVEEVN